MAFRIADLAHFINVFWPFPEVSRCGTKAWPAQRDVSTAEQHAVHDPARNERENAGNDQSSGEETDHGQLVAAHSVMAGVVKPEGQHRQRQDGEQMDRAPRAPDAHVVYPERADGDGQH